MERQRIEQILGRYEGLKFAIVGDFCLDRYFEIDPSRRETSIETDLEVYNITRVRAQSGGAGTILNNLVALGVGRIHVLGFCGVDGEGWLLRRALDQLPGVCSEHFIETELRQTFTYTKPLICEPGKPPRELNRLDQKNWSPTPDALSLRLGESLEAIGNDIDALIVMDQVDVESTGVVTSPVLEALDKLQHRRPDLLIMADSRRGLQSYPKLTYKMNATELAAWKGLASGLKIENAKEHAAALSTETGHPVFVSMADQGIVAATTAGARAHEPARPVRGPIDIVGAGDAVTANLCAALAAGAELKESLHLAMAAASCVIHQLGTTGTASPNDLLK